MTRVFVINDDELSSVEYVSTSTEGAQLNRNKHLKKNIEPLESFRRSSSLPSELLTDDYNLSTTFEATNFCASLKKLLDNIDASLEVLQEIWFGVFIALI